MLDVSHWAILGFLAVSFATAAGWALHAALRRANDPEPNPTYTESLFEALRSELRGAIAEVRGEHALLRQEWQGTQDLLVTDREALAKQYRRIMQAQKREAATDEPEHQAQPNAEPEPVPFDRGQMRRALNNRRRN